MNIDWKVCWKNGAEILAAITFIIPVENSIRPHFRSLLKP